MSLDLTGTATQRYETDAMFRQLVDQLEFALLQAHYTPSEIRDAARLAVIHYANHQEAAIQRDRIEHETSKDR